MKGIRNTEAWSSVPFVLHGRASMPGRPSTSFCGDVLKPLEKFVPGGTNRSSQDALERAEVVNFRKPAASHNHQAPKTP